MLKGVIIVPTFYKKRHERGIKSQRSKFLFDRISQQYGFSVVYTDAPDLKNFDIAVIYAVPYHNRPEIPPGLLNSKAKLIGYFEDLQCWDSEECRKNKEIMFDRFDILMGTYPKAIEKWYPQHVHKYVYFPNFFFPHERYINLQINPNPFMRCLMLGVINKHYPFRVHIRKELKSQSCSLDIPKMVPFDRYSELLNTYFCAVATSGSLESDVHGSCEDALPAKYFEIPAAGVLMLAEEVSELSVIGLEPYTHYVPITKENVFAQVKKCLTSPKKFIKIRDNGTRFIRNNHSIENRVSQFKEILGRL